MIPSRVAGSTEADTLEQLLPQVDGEPTLARARTAVRAQRWAEAAAIYDALVRASPDDARAVAGRGFALSSWGDPRAARHARADFARAIELARDDDRLVSMVEFNFGTLEEREGNLDEARVHFEEADARRPTRAAAEAITRLGGTPEPREVDLGMCDVAELGTAQRADDLRGVLARIVAAQGSNHHGDPPSAATEAEAAALLCEGCDTSAPFTSFLVASDSFAEAHFVVPAEPGYWVLPRLESANGRAARCPDDVGASAASLSGGLARTLVHTLVNYLDDCDMSDPECMRGCFWETRIDRAVFVSTSTGYYAIVSAERDAGLAASDPPPVLRDEMIQVDGLRVTPSGCGMSTTIDLAHEPEPFPPR